MKTEFKADLMIGSLSIIICAYAYFLGNNPLIAVISLSCAFTILLMMGIKKLINEADAKTEISKKPENTTLDKLIRYDPETSLPNSVFFSEMLKKSIGKANRNNSSFAVLLLELDSFDFIRKEHNEATIASIMQELSKRLKQTLREEDVIAKSNNNEFIILLNPLEKSRYASIVADKMLAQLAEPIKSESETFTLSASIGICVYPNDGITIEEIIENAQKALFRAKLAGGHVYQYHTEEIHLEALEYRKLESALRKAISNHEITLTYQPEFNLKTSRIDSVQALMRWEHPVLGIISPDKFIQIAEESNLMMQLGELALEEACKRVKEWQNESGEPITINLKLSSKQLNNPEFPILLAKIIAKSNVNPHNIQLQVSENIVMKNLEVAADALEKLKSTGVLLAIDNFGTGYTSIHHLKYLPIRAIKIDRSITKNIPGNNNECAIVNAMISLGHQLRLNVTAEGVESSEQLDYLTSHNCDVVSGYLLSYPVSADTIILQLNKLGAETV